MQMHIRKYSLLALAMLASASLFAGERYNFNSSWKLTVGDVTKTVTLPHAFNEAVPCSGGTGFFKDNDGDWWCCYFGNDEQSPFREKFSFVKIGFNSEGRIYPALDQPFVPERYKHKWENSWKKVWESISR